MKDLTVYENRFNEDPSSFNDFQAMDYVKELKNQGRLDEAIEVGKTFLEVGENLTAFVNHYAYALYNKFINVADEEIAQKEGLFYSMVEEITNLCKQERYSPLEPTVNKALRYETMKENPDYKQILKLLSYLDVNELSKEPFVNKEGKEFESKQEKWFRLAIKANYELGQYKECIENTNKAFASHYKWHYNNLNWTKYYRASSLVQLGQYDEAENEFLALGHKIPTGDSFEVLYSLYLNTNKEKEAYANLIYKFFNDGYDINHLATYEKIAEMVKTAENKELIDVTAAFIHKLKVENNIESQDEIAEHLDSKTSSYLYDYLYNVLMEHLDLFIERLEGTVVYYNEERMFGSIGQDSEDNLFFRQADYIFDEDVEKFDVVEYSIMKTYDMKKQRATFKAILLKTLEQNNTFNY